MRPPAASTRSLSPTSPEPRLAPAPPRPAVADPHLQRILAGHNLPRRPRVRPRASRPLASRCAGRRLLERVDASAAANSSGWSPQELQRIGDADELQIASRRADGSLRQFVTIWV